MFFGDGVGRDEPGGLDLSRSQCKVIRAEGSNEMGIDELRSCIRR